MASGRESNQNEGLLENDSDHLATGLTVDECLQLAGGWGHYQQRLMMGISCVNASSAAHLLIPIFLIPRLWEAWHLSAGAASMLSSLFFLGYMSGVVLWGYVSDSHGRRPATSLAFTLGNISGIASFAAPNYTSFVFLRFLCGVGIAGSKNGCFLIGTEFAPPSARARVGVLISYSWLAGLLFLVLSAWLLRDCHWRWLVLTYTPALLAQLLLSSLPESPRFSLVAAEPERARLTLLAVFKANGRSPPEPLLLRRPPPATKHAAYGIGRLVATSFGQPCATPTARQMTLVVGFCQAVCTMIFYAITFDPATNAAAGDLYLGALLGALIELPAYMILEPMTNRCGRKRAYCTFLFLSAAWLLVQHHAKLPAAHAINEPLQINEPPRSETGESSHRLVDDATSPTPSPPAANWLAMIAALGGRFSSVAAVNVAYIVAAELFPTSCRNTGVGWGTACGRVGAIIAPMIMLSAPNPLVLFSVLSLIAAALVWLLPESAGVTLADVPDALGCGLADGGAAAVKEDESAPSTPSSVPSPWVKSSTLDVAPDALALGPPADASSRCLLRQSALGSER